MRNLIQVPGDQLDPDTAALAGIDRRRDRIVMIEPAAQSTHVCSHRARIVANLTAAESRATHDAASNILATLD